MGRNTLALSHEQELLRATVDRLARDVYAAKAREWDRDRTVLPEDERRRLAELGLLGLCLPEQYGGAGGELLDALVALEALGRVCLPAAFQVFEANTGAARVIELYGTEDQRRRWLPSIIAGEATMAVSISEPAAGSAATDLTTTARRQAEGYVLDGAKRWCSGAGHAELYLVYVRLGDAPGAKGVGAVVAERDSPGLSFGPQESLMGFHGVASADMFFDAVHVPDQNVVVGPGGFGKLFSAFSIERLGNATMSLALGQEALDRTARYVLERQQFGKDLAEFQFVQGHIADMVMQVEAGRLLIHRAAAKAGRGTPVPLEASIAKCFANQMAKTVTDRAMQLHGGYGYSEEYEIERLHRDAHGWALAGGTLDLQRLRIASEYLGRRFTQRS